MVFRIVQLYRDKGVVMKARGFKEHVGRVDLQAELVQANTLHEEPLQLQLWRRGRAFPVPWVVSLWSVSTGSCRVGLAPAGMLFWL